MKKITSYLVLILFLGTACKQTGKDKAAEVIKEWTGKTIKFPMNIETSTSEKNSSFNKSSSKPYKILLYVDSTGCTSCKLNLSVWKKLISQTDSLMPRQLDFLFYFNPKNGSDLDAFLKEYNFNYPIYIDKTNSINKLNNFPTEMEYQCFLLNKDNKVVMLGNPVLNPKIWELYKKQIVKETI